MARDIDWSKPLSDEDRSWAEQRPDFPAGNGMTVAQRLAEMDNGKTDTRSRADKMDQLRSTIADAQNELARLEQEQRDEDNSNVAVTGDPAVGLVVDNTPVNGERPEGADEAKQTYSDEKVWTKAKLTDELRARNTEREEQGLEPLPLTGNRSELVERLIKDDEELEG